MKITCPDCGFSKDVNPEKLPGESVIATCPKCSCRFRFTVKDARAEDEEDIRVVASRAYQKEANRFRDEASSAYNGETVSKAIPWELAPAEMGWMAAFWQTVVKVMFAAPAFFKSLSPRYQAARVLAFYLIIIVFQTVVERLWGQFFLSVLAPGASSDPQLEKLLAMLAANNNVILGLLLRCGLLLLQLYIFTFLLCFAYRLLAPKAASFGLLFQIMVYSSAPSILCVVPFLGSLAGMIWGIGCLLIGCKVALRLDWGRTIAGFLPIVFLMAPLFVQLVDMATQ